MVNAKIQDGLLENPFSILCYTLCEKDTTENTTPWNQLLMTNFNKVYRNYDNKQMCFPFTSRIL